MRLTAPQIEISREEGFSSEKDIFNRINFGERLANLFENSQDDIVIALDAPWGEGKSTFIKMWQGHVESHREKKFKTIYFDAFANDYQKDPFLALTAEMYDLLSEEDDEKKKEFKEKAGDAIKSMTRGALKIGIRAATGGLLNGSIIDSVDKEVSTLIADQVDNIIADRLENNKKDKSALQHFKSYLQVIAEEQGNGNPIIFIIDELDRCRPDFALELIEQIKHIFSVKGITFLLVLNRNQLEASVKARYGNDVNASLYLQKFVNLWLSIPRETTDYDDHGEKYFKYALYSMLEDDEKFQNKELFKLLIELIKLKKPSYREMERILSYVAIIHNMIEKSEYSFDYQIAIAFICYLKVSSPNIFNEVSNNNINYADLLKETGLEVKKDITSNYGYIEYMNKVIKFDFADEDTRKQMIEEKQIERNRHSYDSTGLLVKVANMLKTMENK